MRILLIASLVATSTLLSGADLPAQQPVFSTHSDLVVLHVTVKDRRGAYVGGLSRDAFAVHEDGRPQRISFLADADTPVTVGLLIDSSGSMLPTRELVIAAAGAFAEASHPGDEIFALAFNEYVRPALPPNQPFTNRADTLRDALDRSIGARGRTALYDAVLAGLEYTARGTRERRVLVVVSDGTDNASRAAAEEVFRRAQGSNAVIYTLALRDPARWGDSNLRLLRELARVTGGAAFTPNRAEEVGTALREIAVDIRHSYTIGYVPTNLARDGSFRRVRVDVRSPDGGRLQIRSRGGYLAGSPQEGPP